MEISIEQRREAEFHEKHPQLREIMQDQLYKGEDIKVVGFGSSLKPGDKFLIGLSDGGVRELTCQENRTPENCTIVAGETYPTEEYKSWECVKIEYLEKHAWVEPLDRNSYAWHRALCHICGRGSNRKVHRNEHGQRIV